MTATTNPFIVTPSEAHRGSYVDCQVLAGALAAQWGAEIGECEAGAYGMGRVILEGGLVVWIRADSRKIGRIEVGASCPTIERNLSHHDRVSFPRISADTGKGLEKLAADLKRRVVALAYEPIAVLREKLAQQNSDREALKAHADVLSARLPMLKIDIPADETNGTANIRGNAGGMYFSGSLSSTGSVSFDRIGSVDSVKALAVLSALFGSEG